MKKALSREDEASLDPAAKPRETGGPAAESGETEGSNTIVLAGLGRVSSAVPNDQLRLRVCIGRGSEPSTLFFMEGRLASRALMCAIFRLSLE